MLNEGIAHMDQSITPKYVGFIVFVAGGKSDLSCPFSSIKKSVYKGPSTSTKYKGVSGSPKLREMVWPKGLIKGTGMDEIGSYKYISSPSFKRTMAILLGREGERNKKQEKDYGCLFHSVHYVLKSQYPTLSENKIS